MLEKRNKFEQDKITAEIQARAEQERLNEDVSLRKLQLQSSLDTAKMITGIQVSEQQQLQQQLQRQRQLVDWLTSVWCVLHYLLLRSGRSSSPAW